MYALSDKIFFCKNTNDANDTFYATKSYLSQCGFNLKIDDNANEGILDWYGDNYTVTRADNDKYEDHEDKTLRCTYDQLFYEDSSMINARIEDLVSNGSISLEEIADDGRYYDEEEDEYPEIFYYNFIDRETADTLVDRTSELVYYIPEMDVNVLGVTHYGTSWRSISTKIKF